MVFIHRKHFVGFCLSGASSIRNKINFQIYDFIFLSKKENSIVCFHFIIGVPLLCEEVNYGATKTIKMEITKGYISPIVFFHSS